MHPVIMLNLYYIVLHNSYLILKNVLISLQTSYNVYIVTLLFLKVTYKRAIQVRKLVSKGKGKSQTMVWLHKMTHLNFADLYKVKYEK